jgi:hypothetical protein
MVHDIGNSLLRNEAFFIDRIFSKVRLNNFHFAEMSSTVALITQARVFTMV